MKAIKREALVYPLLFLSVLLPRLLRINAFITWDEPMWAYRSIRFLMALLRSDFGGTFLVGHPGVITMWAGAAGIAVQRFLLGSSSAADLAWLSELPALDPRDLEALRRLAAFLPAAKLPLAVLNATIVLGAYFLVKKLLGAQVALLATLLLAFDPFYLALSRVLHMDAPAAGFMMLSFLSLLIHLRRDRSRPYLLLSGASAGLAFLSKAYALFLAPFVGLLLTAAYLAQERDFRKAIPLLLCSLVPWCLVAALIFCLLWPAMWVDPWGTARGVGDVALGYAATPHATPHFFLGKAKPDPGPLFYPFVLAFRTTPPLWLGLVAAILYQFTNLRTYEPHSGPYPCQGMRPSRQLEIIALLTYACLFVIFMSLGAKKFDRYMLPPILALDIVAAWGLVKIAGRLSRWGPAILIGALLIQTILVLSYHPYYLAYYNPILGGSRQAPQVLPVGWGEGMDLAARYLNQKEDADQLRVATSGMPGFGPLFKGRAVPFTEGNLATADYILVYISDAQLASPSVAALLNQQPEHTVRIHGIDYVRIHRNLSYKEVIAYLEGQSQAGDVILLDAPSPFIKHYKGPLPCHLIVASQGEAEAVERLKAITAGHKRLWYVAYPEGDPEGWIGRQLDTHALLIRRHAFSYATLSCYLLPPRPAFAVTPIRVDMDVNFNGKLRLTGYGFSEGVVEYRKQLGVTLRWQAQGQMEENYALSLRLVDEQGHPWRQVDEWLEDDASLPTSSWDADEVSERFYALPLPPGIPPGRYRVNAILYHTDTLQRLNVLDEKGEAVGTEYTLGTVSVANPTVPPSIEELAIPYPLRCGFGDQLELLGYDISAKEVRPGDSVEGTLFWQALRPMERDYRLLLQLWDEKGRPWAEGEFPLGSEAYPTSRWREGEAIQGRYDLVVGAAAPTGELSLLINLIDEDSGQSLLKESFPLTRLQATALERRFAVPEEIQHPMRVNLGDQVTFLGYDLDRTAVEPGETLYLTLYWQAQRQMETSYKVFTHLLDTQNRIWGQRDSIPVDGTRPTTGWLENEVIVDGYEIPVRGDAPPGEYLLEIGMYDPLTGERLPVLEEGVVQGDRVLLERIKVLGSAD